VRRVLGSLAQSVVGVPRVADAARAWHASLFCNLDHVVDSLPALAPYSEILSVCADGGALTDRLLDRCPGSRAAILDLSASGCVGVAAERQHRVRSILPSDLGSDRRPPDVILLNDVLHHVAPRQREDFLAALRPLLREHGRVVVKEFAPGGLRARLGWVVDCCLSGDFGVRFLPPAELCALVDRVLPGRAAFQTLLSRLDPPNYCFVFDRLGAA
jgi:hypothetical protein